MEENVGGGDDRFCDLEVFDGVGGWGLRMEKRDRFKVGEDQIVRTSIMNRD